VSTRAVELLAGPLRAMRRATFWWAVGLASIVAATVAFWPAFQGSSGISQAIDQLPSGVVEAFGLQDFGTPAGFLRGNLYELLVPLLLALAAVALANGQTASEEANGRLELILAQPVDRRAVFAARAVAVLVALVILTFVLAVTQVVADAVVGLRIDAGYLVATIALCALLGALYGSLAVALAGIVARPSLVLGVGIALAIGGYLVAALFPLSSLLAPWGHLSPWDWALGGHPLEQPTDAWRYVALAVPSVVLTAVGVLAVGRRDVAAA
jgi:beta-exotoxin I transport system permease protein